MHFSAENCYCFSFRVYETKTQILMGFLFFVCCLHIYCNTFCDNVGIRGLNRGQQKLPPPRIEQGVSGVPV